MSVKDIYNALRSAGMSDAGACGLMGNMQAESSMIANIAQRGMTSLSDADYTAKFDLEPENCICDAVGYGLCQWTHPARRRNLRQFAENWGVSVGTEDMQTEFAIYELKTEYAQLWQYLCKTENLYEAVSRICREYERPTVNNIAVRYAAAEKFRNVSEKSGEERDTILFIMQAILAAVGYEVSITGKGDSRTAAALRKYTEDLEKR